MSANNVALPINAAVGVLTRPDGFVLMAQRPPGKHYAGYWEFPGGKVEDGETVEYALIREFQEELGIDLEPSSITPWCCCEFRYPHAHVRLHFMLCQEWHGEPHGLEGQQLSWQNSPVKVEPQLPATLPLLCDLFEFIDARR